MKLHSLWVAFVVTTSSSLLGGVSSVAQLEQLGQEKPKKVSLFGLTHCPNPTPYEALTIEKQAETIIRQLSQKEEPLLLMLEVPSRFINQNQPVSVPLVLFTREKLPKSIIVNDCERRHLCLLFSLLLSTDRPDEIDEKAVFVSGDQQTAIGMATVGGLRGELEKLFKMVHTDEKYQDYPSQLELVENDLQDTYNRLPVQDTSLINLVRSHRESMATTAEKVWGIGSALLNLILFKEVIESPKNSTLVVGKSHEEAVKSLLTRNGFSLAQENTPPEDELICDEKGLLF